MALRNAFEGMATEATLGQIQTNTDSVETLLDEQSKALGRDFSQAHQAGLNFVGGARLDFGGALASDRYVAAIRNPAANTKVAYVYAVVLYTSVTQWFRWAINPTLDSPTVSDPARSLNLAASASPTVEMLQDTQVPQTADFWNPQTRVTANAPVPLQFPRPVPIPPGITFAVIGDSSATQETCANVYFYEKAAG